MKLLEMRGIRKVFPHGIIANDNISIGFRLGEVHGLVGGNGAGKSTLMKILFGLYSADAGKILIDGKELMIRSPRDAIKLGIAMVPQFPELVESMTVIENIEMILPEKLLRKEKIKRLIVGLSEKYSLEVEPEKHIYELSLGERQRVEILKALLINARILVFDESTSVLTPTETNTFFETLRKLKADRAIIFISHQLEEVLVITDKITVIREGKKISTIETGQATKSKLAEMMLGRVLDLRIEREPRRLDKIEEKVLQVQDLTVIDDRGRVAVDGISFQVRKGEIFGITGIAGNGQKELVQAISGLRKYKGKIYILDTEMLSFKQFLELGIVHIPEDRVGMGVALSLSVFDNLMLRSYRRFSKFGILKLEEMKKSAQRLIEEYSIITPGLNTPTGYLSGGNIARLVNGRELSGAKNLVIAANPTFGLDIASSIVIRKKLIGLRDNGYAILLVSGDLEEILQLSDTMAVIYKGKFMGNPFPREEAKLKEIGLMIGGVRK